MISSVRMVYVLNLDMVKPVGEDFQHCVQSSPGLLLENLK